MADFKTTGAEELLINQITAKNSGFEIEGLHKYHAIRVALGLGLRMPAARYLAINEKLENADISIDGKEYNLAQITDYGKPGASFDLLLRALFFARHEDELAELGADIFAADGEGQRVYLEILARYIHRGFYELGRTFKASDDFYLWLKDSFGFSSNSAILSGDYSGEIGENLGENHANSDAANALFDKIRDYFFKFGIKIKLLSTMDSYRNTALNIEVADASQLNAFESRFGQLANAIGEAGAMFFTQNHKGLAKTYSVQISKPQNRWQELGVREFMQALNARPSQMALPIFVGNDIAKMPHFMDLSALPHLLVAGKTGGGKSVLLQAIILYLLKTTKAEILIMDRKNGGDFDAFTGHAELLTDQESIAERIAHLLAVMDERNAQIRAGAPLQPLVIIIDELRYLVDENKSVLSQLTSIASVGRSAKMHLVLCTQRVDAATFGGQLLNNINGRICLKVQDATAARLVGVRGAELLQGRGDIIASGGEVFERVLGVKLEGAQITSILSQN